MPVIFLCVCFCGDGLNPCSYFITQHTFLFHDGANGVSLLTSLVGARAAGGSAPVSSAEPKSPGLGKTAGWSCLALGWERAVGRSFRRRFYAGQCRSSGVAAAIRQP